MATKSEPEQANQPMLALPVSRSIKEGVAEIAAFLIGEKNKAREPLLQRIADVERELAAVREAHTEANQRASNVQAQLQDKTAELDRVRAELQTTLQLLEERRALIQNLEKERAELASTARAQEAPPPLTADKNDDVMMSDEAPEPILNPEGGFPESSGTTVKDIDMFFSRASAHGPSDFDMLSTNQDDMFMSFDTNTSNMQLSMLSTPFANFAALNASSSALSSQSPFICETPTSYEQTHLYRPVARNVTPRAWSPDHRAGPTGFSPPQDALSMQSSCYHSLSAEPGPSPLQMPTTGVPRLPAIFPSPIRPLDLSILASPARMMSDTTPVSPIQPRQNSIFSSRAASVECAQSARPTASPTTTLVGIPARAKSVAPSVSGASFEPSVSSEPVGPFVSRFLFEPGHLEHAVPSETLGPDASADAFADIIMTANPADINMPAELATPVGALPPLLFDMHAEIHAWPSTSEVTLEASDDLAMFQGDGNAVVMPTSMHENAGPVPGTNASGANVGDTNSKTRGGTFERQPEKRVLVIPSPPPHMRPRRVLKPKVDVSAEARGQSFYIPG